MTTAARDTTPECTVPAWFSSATSDVLQVTTFCNDMHTGQRADGDFETLIVGNNTMSGVARSPSRTVRRHSRTRPTPLAASPQERVRSTSIEMPSATGT